MKKSTPYAWMPCAGLLFFIAAAMPASAQVPRDPEEAALERGAIEDTTPQQRYRTAVREAGGGLKVGLEECRALAQRERGNCQAQVQQRYRIDMAHAKAILQDPQARPISVLGDPIRSSETTYPVK